MSNSHDEIQKILDKADLWDVTQSKVSGEDSFSETVWRYIADKVPTWVRVSGMIAATIAPIVVGLISGTQTNWFGGVVGALAAVLVEGIIALFLYLFFVPSRIWNDVAGDLKAARSQIKDDKVKLGEMATIARRNEQSYLEAQTNFRAAESQLSTMRGQLQAARDEVSRLTAERVPKLSIIFDESAREFVDATKIMDGGYLFDAKLYRVAIHSRTTATVHLKIDRAELTHRVIPRLHLRPTHKPDQKQVRIDKDTHEFWDIVEKKDIQREWVQLMETDTPTGTLLRIPSTFTISASSEEGIGTSKMVELTLKENGDLNFQLSDT